MSVRPSSKSDKPATTESKKVSARYTCRECGKVHNDPVDDHCAYCHGKLELSPESETKTIFDIKFGARKGIKSFSLLDQNGKVLMENTDPSGSMIVRVEGAAIEEDVIDLIKEIVGRDLLDVAIEKLQKLSALRVLMDNQK